MSQGRDTVGIAALALRPDADYAVMTGRGSSRVFLPKETLPARWRSSRVYPASRRSARIAKAIKRLGTAVSPRILRTPPGEWELGDAAQAAGINACDVVVVLAGPTPAQKALAYLIDERGVLAAVAKIAWTPVAARRIRNEREMLEMLGSRGVPRVLGIHSTEGGVVLFLGVVPGRRPHVSGAPVEEALEFLRALHTGDARPFETHPFVTRLGGAKALSSATARLLGDRAWGVPIMHGDFAPWNMLLDTREAGLTVLDWEYGSEAGFPGVDELYHRLQVKHLMQRARPEQALGAATREALEVEPGLSYRERLALAEMTARHVASERIADGLAADSEQCLWWTAVAEEAAGMLEGVGR